MNEEKGKKRKKVPKAELAALMARLRSQFTTVSCRNHLQWWRAAVLDGKDGRLLPGQNEVSFVKEQVSKMCGANEDDDGDHDIGAIPVHDLEWKHAFPCLNGNQKPVQQNIGGFFALQFPA